MHEFCPWVVCNTCPCCLLFDGCFHRYCYLKLFKQAGFWSLHLSDFIDANPSGEHQLYHELNRQSRSTMFMTFFPFFLIPKSPQSLSIKLRNEKDGMIICVAYCATIGKTSAAAWNNTCSCLRFNDWAQRFACNHVIFQTHLRMDL